MDQRERLVAELRRLRGRRGLTIDGLNDCLAIAEALGAPNPASAYERLLNVIAELRDDLYTNALRAAYGITDNGGTLTKRRENYGSQKSVERSPDTLEIWENKVIEDLATYLLSGPSTEPTVDLSEITVAELIRLDLRDYPTASAFKRYVLGSNGGRTRSLHWNVKVSPSNYPSRVQLYMSNMRPNIEGELIDEQVLDADEMQEYVEDGNEEYNVQLSDIVPPEQAIYRVKWTYD